MYGLVCEEHSFGANPGTKDLARHMYTRMFCGKIVIIANNPAPTLAALRKQWLKLARKAQKESASTLNAVRIYELNQLITRMLMMEFTIKWPAIDYPADVYLVTVEQALQWAPECRTLYVTSKLQSEQLHLITAWMPKGSLVVFCYLAHA